MGRGTRAVECGAGWRPPVCGGQRLPLFPSSILDQDRGSRTPGPGQAQRPHSGRPGPRHGHPGVSGHHDTARPPCGRRGSTQPPPV